MGRLVARAYGIKLAPDRAEHTYVECGTGAVGWGCWGGKTGGRVLRDATGSTRQANQIAGDDERAGITCYLVNGVCHQAANRVLFPAGILVDDAVGYWLSEALFGTYGRPRAILGLCAAPFHQHSAVTGDLAKCRAVRAAIADESDAGGGGGSSLTRGERSSRRRRRSARYTRYQREAARRLTEAHEGIRALDQRDLMGFAIVEFVSMIGFRMRSDLGRSTVRFLQETRSSVEKRRLEVERAFAEDSLPHTEFAAVFDRLTLAFQDDLANTLTASQYRVLLDLGREQRITLADPEQMAAAWGDRG